MDFTLEEIKILVELCSYSPDEFTNYTTFSKHLNLNTSDKRFIRLKNWLIERGILTERATIGNSKFIDFDNKKLIENIPEIDFVKYFHEDFISRYWKKRAWDYK